MIVLAVAATARLTRLVTADTITAPLRVAVVRKWGPSSMANEFIHCAWCVGMWLSLATAALTVAALDLSWWLYLPLALAYSHVVGLAARLDH